MAYKVSNDSSCVAAISLFIFTTPVLTMLLKRNKRCFSEAVVLIVSVQQNKLTK